MKPQSSLRERLFGPLIIVFATLLYHWLFVLGYAPLTVAILFPFVVVAAITSGLRAGLVAAVWVSIYSAWLIWPQEISRVEDISRIVVIAISLIATNLMVGWLKRQSRIARETRRKAELADELNGNINQLHKIEHNLSNLLEGWNVLADDAKRREVKTAHSLIASLTTITAGWRELWKERSEIIEEHEKERDSEG